MFNLTELSEEIHTNAEAKGFWETKNKMYALEVYVKGASYLLKDKDPESSEQMVKIFEDVKKDFLQFHRTTLIMLVVTELAEAVEGLRHSDEANHAEEIADTVIRALDYCKGYGIDIEKAVADKMERNAQRPPMHGKKF